MAVGTLPVAAATQTAVFSNPFGTAADATATPSSEIGGTQTIDVIRLSGEGPGVPLRFGGVAFNSEVVLLDGVRLRRGLDYQLDASLGVVYLMRASRAGQILHVSYRYKKGYTPPAGSAAGFGTLSYDVAPGALSFRAGFGLAERQSDGSVLTSNIYGWNNSFGFGQSKLDGMFFIGRRTQVDASSGFEYQTAPGRAEQGDSSFILQKLTSALRGGTVQAEYQEISKNFTAYQAVRESGADQAAIDRLTKEKGMTRLGFSMTNVDVAGAKLSQSFKEVADGAGKIQWQSYGFQQGGLQLGWNLQTVDKKFARFNDIAENDRAQLAKEGGMSRETLTGSLTSKAGKLSFEQSGIGDGSGGEITRRNFTLDSSKFKLNVGEQDIDSTFTRFGSLGDPQQAQLAKERGMSRNWMAFDYALYGAKTAPIHYAQSSLTNESGGFTATEASATVGKWSLGFVNLASSQGFTGLGSLSATEVEGGVKNVASMFGADVAKIQPTDRNLFTGVSGLSRTMSQISGEPFKGWKMAFDSYDVKGGEGGASANRLALTGNNLSGSYSRQHVASDFAELGSLMSFERVGLGQIAGSDRTDWSLGGKLGGNRSFSFAQTDAGAPGGSFNRTLFGFADKGIEIKGGSRQVGAAFPVGGQLVDPERDLVTALQGFNEQDLSVKWNVLSNLHLESYMFDASNSTTGVQKMLRNTVLAWNPDKRTSIGFLDLKQKDDDPFQLLLANSVERFTLARDFGRFGQLNYLSEAIDYSGTLAGLPSSRKEYVAYQTQINSKTSLKTEQTTTSYDNGDKENISSNTVSTELSKRVGVSVSEVAIDRGGDDRDEQKRNYGFWWDIGNGLRFSYGYARQLTGPNGTQMETMGLTASPGTPAARLGMLGIGAANYSLTETNSVATQGANNVQLSTLQPLNFGLLKDVKMSFAYDALNNNATWVKENHFFGFNGKVGSNTVSFEYKGQALPTGAKGVDRAFGVTTDQAGKRPLQASVQYKVRSLPNGEDIMIRNFNVTARPLKGLELSNQVITNPEVAKGDALLGSVVQGSRASRWKLDYSGNPDLVVGGSWEELVNDQSHASSRTAGLNMTLFKRSGSPVTLFYGLEDTNKSAAGNKACRYYLQFDQRPGPNQMFSLFLGNVSYEGAPASGFSSENWSLRMDYQLRF